MSVWFITGASRGFGLELATSVLDRGDQVIATARDPQAMAEAFLAKRAELAGDLVDETPPDLADSLLTVRVDVTDRDQVAAAVAEGVARFGRIDLVVNNAGYGLFGGVEEISDAEARALFDTNVFGLLNVTRAALPTLRAQGAGRVINIGSSAGFAVGAGRGMYGASKFAVEAITEALHAELAPLGIHVTIVEPGSFRTNFLTAESKRQAQVSIAAYGDTVGKLYAAMEANDGQQPGDPVKAVAAIRQLATMTEPPLRLQLGSDCVSLVEGKLASVAEELEQWRDLAMSTDFEST